MGFLKLEDFSIGPCLSHWNPIYSIFYWSMILILSSHLFPYFEIQWLKLCVYFLSLPLMLHIPPILFPFFKPLGVTVNKSGGDVFLCVDSDQHGILLPHPSGQIHPEACVWGTQSVWTATHQGQVLELRLLQVHLCVWSHKCAVHGWSGAVVFMVLRTRVSSPSSPTLQGSFWICEYYGRICINNGLCSVICYYFHTYTFEHPILFSHAAL